MKMKRRKRFYKVKHKKSTQPTSWRQVLKDDCGITRIEKDELAKTEQPYLNLIADDKKQLAKLPDPFCRYCKKRKPCDCH
jgi:hypothetical protein